MKCIICKKDSAECEFNDEHVFPESIGGGFCVKSCVCATCNSLLGTKVDSILVDHPIIKLARFSHRIPNKDGIVPNPFGTGTDTLDPTIKISWKSDKKGEMSNPHIYPSISCEEKDDGSFNIKIHADESDEDNVLEMIQKRMQRKYGRKFSIEELQKHIMPLKHGSKHVMIHYNEKFDINDHIACFLKIVYELAYYWLGPQYLDDDIGENLQNFLYDMAYNNYSVLEGLNKYDIRGTARIFQGRPIIKIPKVKDCHYAIIYKHGNNLLCYIQIFDFEALIPVSLSGDLYPDFENRCILINYKEKTYTEFSNFSIVESFN